MRIFFVKNRVVVVIFPLLLLSQQSLALEFSSSLSSETLYTNNSGLKSTSKLDDIVQTTGLNMTIKEDRKNFQTDASISLQSENYFNNTFTDTTSLTTGLGVLNFDIIESFLNWNTYFSRREVLKDTDDLDTPDNREFRNILRTGPVITYAISRYSTLGLSANYINVENSNDEVSDAEKVSGSVSYSYLYNPLTLFKVSSDYEGVIDGDGDDEYDDVSFNAGFTRKIVNGEIEFRFTRSQLELENSELETTDTYYFTMSRNHLFFHDFLFVYEQEIADSSTGFDDGGLDTSAGPAGTVTQNAVLKRDQASLDVSRTMGSYSYSINGFWEKEGVLASIGTLSAKRRDKSRGGSLRIEQQFSPFLTLGFGVEYEINDFVGRPEIGKDIRNNYNFDTAYTVSEDLSLNAYVRYEIRSNDQNSTREYEEFATGFGLEWRLF